MTRCIRAAGLAEQFRPCYTTIAATGKRADRIAARLVQELLKPLVAGRKRLVFAIDDTPTPRYGPLVQGAGSHHNPCSGPTNAPFVYGHVWVVLGLLAGHPLWGVIALPLLARLSVRQKDLAGIDERHRPVFRTKLALAVALVRGATCWLGFWGKPLWVVADGAYAKAAFLKPLLARGVVAVSAVAEGRGAVGGAHAPSGQAGPPPNRWAAAHRVGQAGRAEAGVDGGDVPVVRQGGGQAVQDVPADLTPGRRCDPGSMGGRTEGVGRVLVHRPGGDRGGPSGSGSRPVQPGDVPSRLPLKQEVGRHPANWLSST